MGDFLDSWAGEAVNWECDSLGHLNMRYYAAYAGQARQFFIINLGLPAAFTRGAVSTVRVREMFIRYLKEARPGAQLKIRTGLLSLTPSEMELVHIMYHADGSAAASITEKLDHISLSTQQAFDWPSRVYEAASAYQVDLPDVSKPKAVSLTEPMSGPDREQVQNWGLERIGQGVFTPAESNLFHTIAAQHILGRASDMVGQFRTGWPEAFETKPGSHQVMGALLEMRLKRHRPVLPGMGFEFYSGLRKVNRSTREIVHNLVDTVSGENLVSTIAISALLDLKARKIVQPSAAQRAKLEDSCLADITG